MIRIFLSFELADIFKSMGVVYFSKKLLKTPISILIAKDEKNTTSKTRRGMDMPFLHLRDCIFWACHYTGT